MPIWNLSDWNRIYRGVENRLRSENRPCVLVLDVLE